MKKSLCFILSLIMILSILTSVPVTVVAADSNDYLTFWLSDNEKSYQVRSCSKDAKGEIVIPKTFNGLPVESIGWMAFSGTDKGFVSEVTSVVIPISVTYVEQHAFQDCVHLEKIKIPDSVVDIGYGAFMNCEKLIDIKLPSKITKIGFNTFDGCSSLSTIVIPNLVVSIGNNSFYDCKNLKSVVISKSVTSIGSYAFYNCPNLTSVLIPSNVTTICNGAFGFYNNNDTVSVKVEDFTIYGVKDTAAETYANENGFTFIEICEHKTTKWITDKKATVNEEGSKHKECTECGEILETATIKQLKCSEPKHKTIANTSSGVKITWGKVSGADSYAVYRKTKGGKYKKIGTTTKTYYTDKKASTGKKYYYIVKAVNEAGSSDSSSSLSKYYLADPTLKTPKSTKSGVSLKWTKTTGAQGYIIYRKTGSGSYKKLKTEKGVSNLSYVDKSAKKGKKYTYKVKAYYSKTYSAYSNTKTIKDKY